MTIVYRLPERTFLRQNVLAFGMLFLFITIIPIMLVASSAPTALIGVIPGGGGRFGAFLGGMIFSLLVAFILFEAIYWFVPNKKMSFKVTWCGALVAACTLEIFIILFPLYVTRFMDNYAGKLNLFFFNKYILLSKRTNWFCCYSSSILLLFCYNSYFGCTN
jgi:uncharacterized BrkB/YihY/UPF0761 family membrane protein